MNEELKALTDDAIIGLLAKAADELDATRVHEPRNGGWHSTTIFDGDAAALRFARMVEQATLRTALSYLPPQTEETRAAALEEAAKVCDGLAEMAHRIRGIASSSTTEAAAAHGQLEGYRHAADAIRALSQPKEQTT